jgi:hypothetical protein
MPAGRGLGRKGGGDEAVVRTLAKRRGRFRRANTMKWSMRGQIEYIMVMWDRPWISGLQESRNERVKVQAKG